MTRSPKIKKSLENARRATSNRLEIAQKLLKELQHQVGCRQADVDSAEINWGHAGDAEYYVIGLANIVESMGNAHLANISRDQSRAEEF